jgi:3-mercaptopyruvate sulfurtransferase SseA
MLATTLVTLLIALFGTTQDGSEPWKETQLIEPAALASRLADARSAKPTILYVGPKLLYRAHIPGALLAGPAGQGSGLDLLKQAAGKLPHDREVVIYCGCCPWKQCPNIRPAFRVLGEMGFKQVKVLTLPTSFLKDWMEKDYPVEKER